jgi:hypothetical protein
MKSLRTIVSDLDGLQELGGSLAELGAGEKIESEVTLPR